MAGCGWQDCLNVEAGLWFERWTDDDACVERGSPREEGKKSWWVESFTTILA